MKELQPALKTLAASPLLSIHGTFERSAYSAVEKFQRKHAMLPWTIAPIE